MSQIGMQSSRHPDFFLQSGPCSHGEVYVFKDTRTIIESLLESVGNVVFSFYTGSACFQAIEEGEKVEVDPDVGAVIASFDRHINYYKIQYATVCLCTLPGCHFVATNLDARDKTETGFWAAAGAMVRSTFLLQRVCGALSQRKLLLFRTHPNLEYRQSTDVLGQHAGTSVPLSCICHAACLLSEEAISATC